MDKGGGCNIYAQEYPAAHGEKSPKELEQTDQCSRVSLSLVRSQKGGMLPLVVTRVPYQRVSEARKPESPTAWEC